MKRVVVGREGGWEGWANGEIWKAEKDGMMRDYGDASSIQLNFKQKLSTIK